MKEHQSTPEYLIRVRRRSIKHLIGTSVVFGVLVAGICAVEAPVVIPTAITLIVLLFPLFSIGGDLINILAITLRLRHQQIGQPHGDSTQDADTDVDRESRGRAHDADGR